MFHFVLAQVTVCLILILTLGNKCFIATTALDNFCSSIIQALGSKCFISL